MLKFKKIEISDIEKIKTHTNIQGNFSCETSFVNLLVWQNIYNNMYAEKDGILFIKSVIKGYTNFRLPFGSDITKGVELLREYCGEQEPILWIQQAERFNEIAEHINENYQLYEHRDTFDYIYLRSDLANLSGKKYHSKRNHISAFSKKYNWTYCDITDENKEDILQCAELWYKANSERYDEYMECEFRGSKTILENMEALSVSGGAIYIDGKAVAFTLGSPINDEVFDVHIEKALPEYAAAYTVINNEFAKRLAQYKYINREDDMGIEGLRKAKLSYKPEILLKKYLCMPKKQVCQKLYHKNFADGDDAFENELFSECFKYCHYLEKDGKIVSICFAFPCKIGEKSAKYIFGVATDENERNKGYATELLNIIKAQSDDILILRPVNDNVIDFYKKLGFKTFKATNQINDFCLTPNDDFYNLAKDEKEERGTYTAMYLSNSQENLENLYFPYSMI